ncbi:hypothetical protein C8P64_2155 [Christiangramia gaetbulicola]|uniref:Uncharacterized protein n=1 Tax=Christiangramia gaetbulicola TaxID=703340 RepID=A0A2T6AIH9_9FLAO|nr:hypothetical protein [Christiangramia gaetbulicola]PTX43625.1 hypothetical protein C8P64_2155 [Christiangramia gaetbulicola]
MLTRIIISTSLIFLFLGKLIIVEAHLLNVISEGSITIVNPNCKKKRATESKKPSFSGKDTTAHHQIFQIAHLCNSYYNKVPFEWSIAFHTQISLKKLGIISNNYLFYPEQHSPPPKIA